MIVLDTNVLSEPMKPTPEAAVLSWLDAQDQTELVTTSTVISELAYGVSRLPEGRRRDQIAERLDRVATSDFLQGILDFDLPAAMEYGALVAAVERNGRPISVADVQIAAVCRVHHAVLATRKVRHFARLGIGLVNPWTGRTYQAPGL